MSFADYEEASGAAAERASRGGARSGLRCERCGAALRRRLANPDLAVKGRWHDRIAAHGEERVYRDELRSASS